MDRAQIVIDEELLSRVRRVARASKRSVSAVVREALAAYLSVQEADTDWIGSLPPGDRRRQAHDWESIERSIEKGLRKESRR